MRFLITFLFLLITRVSVAQLSADALNRDPALASALSIYVNSLGMGAGIYAGPENADPRYPVNDGTPFFLTDQARYGDVLFEGVLYTDIPMWYDLVANEVVIQHPKMNARIALNNNKIGYFSIEGHQFVSPDRTLAGSETMPQLFYELLHDGKTALLGKYTKKSSEIIKESQYMTNYTRQQNQYFLRKDGRYYPVRNTSALLKLLNDNEINQYERSSRPRSGGGAPGPRETVAEAMVRVLKYYDQHSL